MNHRNLLAAFVTIILVATAKAQVVPPGHDADWKRGYSAGFDDATVAAAQFGPSAWPADVIL
jgi:hypothetical protein